MSHPRTWANCRPLRIVGVMSGTSVDAIDAVCVEIQPSLQAGAPLQVQLLGAKTRAYPPQLRQRILEIAGGEALTLPELNRVDDAIAAAFAAAIADVAAGRPIDAIGSHGQTVFHRPPSGDRLGYSLQLGRGEAIAALTGIPTVSNFRAADIALGGHGAPLVPRIDALLLRHERERRCIQNIGGIGNVTLLPPLSSSEAVVGWDTGPGNLPIDLAACRLSGGKLSYDKDGRWAASGTPHHPLVDEWLEGEFFQQRPPKSTGRELFSAAYLERCLADCAAAGLSDCDIMATLTELTAVSIADSYRRFLPAPPDRVALCGGGIRNPYLVQRLQDHLDPIPVVTTAELGLDPDLKEAIAFAVLAYLRLHQIPGNLPSVTGASHGCLLGELHGDKNRHNVPQLLALC
nr:anhydro-N-acetylmuramic acid kinase [Synechococcus sp. PCC 7336]